MFDTLAVLAAIAITIGSLTPLPQLPDVPSNDKIMHLVAYGVLAFLASFHRRSLIRIFFIVVAVSAFGGMIELIQPFANRFMSLGDTFANILGACLGASAAVMIRGYFTNENG